MGFEYTILENGLDFVLTAVKDLLSIDENAPDSKANKRHIKYSLLHLSSGIELVLKYRLLQEHWTYVFSDMNKAASEKLKSGNFESAGIFTIIERLETFCDIKLKGDKKKRGNGKAEILTDLRKKRNRIEHFSLIDDSSIMIELIHNCITILIEVILEYYE